MHFEPIIKAKLKNFQISHELDTLVDSIIFERFVNETILTSHQPDAFSIESDLSDIVSVGGPNDMGIDGLCIKFNGIFIRSIEDIDDLLGKFRKSSIEFIFIQSKYKDKFDYGEYTKFIDGVTDFISENHYQPNNEQIAKWLEIKNYIFSDKVMMTWAHNPHIRLYYVVMGKWNENQHIIAKSSRFIADVNKMGTYDEVNIRYIDSEAFKKICDNNENTYTTIINIIDTFSLTEVENVNNSIVILCSADELMRTLITEDGIIRKALFNDNVRDYQGDTTINSEIYDTVKNDPKSFVLLNNGITIVCDSVLAGNRKITITNPQVVNGCQTCNVLYSAYKNGIPLKDATLTVKVISTDYDDVTNRIVKGTNRQNIVYDEAFEITRQFHKDLEELFATLSSSPDAYKVYYERRSKQYANNTSIKATEKINFRVLIQSFVACFLYSPHLAYRHESKLLQDYKNIIFMNDQSKYPYYISALLYSKLDRMFRDNIILREFLPFKLHLLMVIKEILVGKSPDINKEKQIDEYCGKLMEAIKDDETFRSACLRSLEIFKRTREEWINMKGVTYKYGIKDSSDFTPLMTGNIYPKEKSYSVADTQYRGRVLRISYDRNGQRYGFISRYPDDIFFHVANNANLDIEKIVGKDVLYSIMTDPKTGNEKAIEINLIQA